MQRTEERVITYDGMGEFLFRKWMDDDIEPDDYHQDEWRYQFARFGRRVIEDQDGTPIDYTRHATIADACRHMERLHTNRPPTKFDALVIFDHGEYFVSVEGVHVDGSWPSERLAHRALAQQMVDDGCFPDAFWTDRGDYRRIDSDVREFHDAGGTDMLPDPLAGRRFASGGVVWEVVASTATIGHVHNWGPMERSRLAGTLHHVCTECGVSTLAGDLKTDADDGSVPDGVEIDAVPVGDDTHHLHEMGDIRVEGHWLSDTDDVCSCGQDGCTAECDVW